MNDSSARRIDPTDLLPTDEEADARATLRTVVRDCLAAGNGDWSASTSLMRSKLIADRRLFDELLMPMLDTAIYNLMRLESNSQQRTYLRVAKADDASGLNHVAQFVKDDLLNTPLRNGLKLGDADRDRLSEEIVWRRALAAGNTKKADFFGAILKNVPAGKRVRDVMTHDQIKKIAGKFL